MKKSFLTIFYFCIVMCLVALLTSCDFFEEESSAHIHTYGDWIAEVPATCSENGVRGHYHCAECGKDFDEQFAEISLIIFAGHVYGTDNECIRCHQVLHYTDGLSFSLNDNGTEYSVSKGNVKNGEVIIPYYYKGLPVTSISNSAFFGCTGISRVVVPDSITTIGTEAFRGCPGLAQIEIGNGIITIGNDAFDGCTGLVFETYDNAQYLGNEHNPYVVLIKAINTSIVSCVIHDNTRLICRNAFKDCISLKNVTINNSVRYIEESAFRRCTKLTSVTIPDSVTTIGASAFHECTALKSISVGKGVKSIGSSAFSKCKGLSNVYITDLAKWCDISFSYQSNPLVFGHKLFVNGELVSNLVIPEGITCIKDYSFCGCTSITSFSLPESVNTIGNSAFDCCRGLTAVSIPENVTSIGDLAFRNCTKLMSIEISKDLTSIGISSFFGCATVNSITVANDNPVYHSSGNCLIETESKMMILGCVSSVIPTDGSVTSIGPNAFYGCTELKSIVIPDCVETIGSSAFQGCTGLTSVTIPNCVKSIGKEAFLDCEKLSSVIFVNTTGWKAYWLDKSKPRSMNVTDAMINARNLKSDSTTNYGGYYWYRE